MNLEIDTDLLNEVYDFNIHVSDIKFISWRTGIHWSAILPELTDYHPKLELLFPLKQNQNQNFVSSSVELAYREFRPTTKATSHVRLNSQTPKLFCFQLPAAYTQLTNTFTIVGTRFHSLYSHSRLKKQR